MTCIPRTLVVSAALLACSLAAASTDGLLAPPGTAADAAYQRGRSAYDQGDYQEAVACLEDATQQRPGSSEYHLWLGRAYGRYAQDSPIWRQPGLAGKVRRSLERAVALDPDNLPARFDLLRFYRMAPRLLGGGIDKARAEAEAIKRRDSEAGSQAFQLVEHGIRDDEVALP